MKIFLSWSGLRSRAVAKALNEWLPSVIQAVKPFYSSEIEKGSKWSKEIDDALDGTSFGIICLTPENLHSTWIHYETGALSKTQDTSIWTFLFGLTPTDVHFPLGKFQHTIAEKDDVLQLLKAINGKLENPLTDRILEENFELHWPNLEKKLKDAEENIGPVVEHPPSDDPEYKKFLAFGMVKLHDPMTDENLRDRLGSSKDIMVLKTWFPESTEIETGLEWAITNQNARIRLLLCKPESAILQQRSLGAHEKAWWGSYKVYHAVDKIYKLIKNKPEADVKIACYDSWPGCPVIWYDEEIIMGFYFRGKASPAWPWVSVDRGSRLALILHDQFKELWELSDEHLDTLDEMNNWLNRNKRFGHP